MEDGNASTSGSMKRSKTAGRSVTKKGKSKVAGERKTDKENDTGDIANPNDLKDKDRGEGEDVAGKDQGQGQGQEQNASASYSG